MALVMIEGWDLYNTTDNVTLGNWTEIIGTPLINTTGGRSNGHHVECASDADIIRKDILNVNNPNKFYQGFHFKVDTAGTGTFIRWTDSRNTDIEIATLRLTASGAIEFRDGSGPTLLGSTANDLIVAGTWYVIEVCIKPSVNSFGLPTSSGEFELRIDGTVRIGPLTLLAIGAVTQGATGFGKFELLGDTGNVHRFDDTYFFNDVGPLNGDFAGDFNIQTLRPASDTSTASWTAVSAGVHFEEVNDVVPDGDSTYVSSQETTAADIYELTNLTGSIGAILGYGPMVMARRESGATQNIGIRMIGASETVSFAAQNVPQTYEIRVNVRDQSVDDASDTVPPTLSEVNALQAGVYLP